MLDFIVNNISTIIILAVVISVILLAIRQIKKDKKEGKSPCGCKCSGCASASICHGNKK